MLCNMAVRPYNNLSDNMKAMVHNLKALHSGMATFQRSIAATSDARPIDKSEIKPPTAHPIVRTPEGTNQQAIFVNPHFTIEIEDVAAEESCLDAEPHVSDRDSTRKTYIAINGALETF